MCAPQICFGPLIMLTAIDLDNEDDPLEVIERLRAARKAVAEQQVQ